MNFSRHYLIGPIVVLFIWFAVSAFGLVDKFFLPGPVETFRELFSLVFSGFLLADIGATVFRVLLAFSISLLIGIPIGLALGSSRKLYESLEFVIDFFRSVPATAVFPLFLLIFGIDDASKIAAAVFASFLIILFNTAHGVMHSNKQRVLAARLMGATKIQIFRFISFWESLPQIFTGVRISLSIALIVIVVTEMFIGTYSGLGRRIIDFQYTYNIAGMYAVIILTGVIGYLMNICLIAAERRIVHWSGKQ